MRKHTMIVFAALVAATLAFGCDNGGGAPSEPDTVAPQVDATAPDNGPAVDTTSDDTGTKPDVPETTHPRQLKYGEIVVKSDPAGMVTVADEPLDVVTPHTVSYPAGECSVSVKPDKWMPTTKTVSVPADDMVEVAFSPEDFVYRDISGSCQLETVTDGHLSVTHGHEVTIHEVQPDFKCKDTNFRADVPPIGWVCIEKDNALSLCKDRAECATKLEPNEWLKWIDPSETTVTEEGFTFIFRGERGDETFEKQYHYTYE